MQSRRILVVDDDDDARELLAEFLADLGHTIETAQDGAAALSRLEVFPPELLVTDLEMPAMDGLELIAAVQERIPTCPSLLVTARSEAKLSGPAPMPEGDPAKAASGPVRFACLVKPLDLDDVAAAVERLTVCGGDGTRRRG